jgi:hypothetical protein
MRDAAVDGRQVTKRCAVRGAAQRLLSASLFWAHVPDARRHRAAARAYSEPYRFGSCGSAFIGYCIAEELGRAVKHRCKRAATYHLHSVSVCHFRCFGGADDKLQHGLLRVLGLASDAARRLVATASSLRSVPGARLDGHDQGRYLFRRRSTLLRNSRGLALNVNAVDSVRAGAHAKLDLRQNAEGLYDVVGAREAHVAGISQVRAVIPRRVCRDHTLLEDLTMQSFSRHLQRGKGLV